MLIHLEKRNEQMKKNNIKVIMLCLSILFSFICFYCMSIVGHCEIKIKGYWDPSGQYHELPPDEPTTPEEELNIAIENMRFLGWSEADIQSEIPSIRKRLGLDVSTPSIENTTTSDSSSTPAKETPSYTNEQIEAAWEETERVDPTCVAEGSITYKNSLTGKTKTETIPATGLHTYEVTEHVDATCTADGYETLTCSLCGDANITPIPATGHTESTPVITKNAGWFTEGESTVYCAVCGDVMSTEVISQTCPLALWQIIAISASVIVVSFTIIIIAIKSKSKVLLQNSTT